MMKYIEELNFGELFTHKDDNFIKTIDFRKTKNSIQYFCISINSGKPNWLDGNTEVSSLDLYTRDSDGNILPLKNYQSDINCSTKN